MAGSGDTFPYILRKYEPWCHKILCVDLSQRTINRARSRLLCDFKPTRFLQANIDEYLSDQEGCFHHIDCYGVLHHLPSPENSLKLLSKSLAPSGTLRVMVYNSEARKWILDIKRAFTLLRFDPYSRQDRHRSLQLLDQLAVISESLRYKLGCIGLENLKSPARLMDTFFHAREAVISLERWLEMFASAGLVPYALFDRYGELDDLPNPLWQMPMLDELQDRIKRANFRNNFEFFLCHKDILKQQPMGVQRVPLSYKIQNMRAHLMTPPVRWFQYEETCRLSLRVKYLLWHYHLNSLAGWGQGQVEHLLDKMEVLAQKRLARIGAILPAQLSNMERKRYLMEPLDTQTSSIEVYEPTPLEETSIPSLIESYLKEKKIYAPFLLEQILKRLNRSQQ